MKRNLNVRKQLGSAVIAHVSISKKKRLKMIVQHTPMLIKTMFTKF